MKKFALSFTAILALALVSAAVAQQPNGKSSNRDEEPTIQVAPTAEMWFYQQYQREQREFQDPWAGVRRKAEFAAAQRQARIASMKWFGYSNSRPVANPTPWGSMYSPAWSSNSSRPYGWTGQATVPQIFYR